MSCSAGNNTYCAVSFRLSYKEFQHGKTVLKFFIYVVLRRLCYQPRKPFCIVTAVCTAVTNTNGFVKA